jgi:hypothetical protein
VPAIYAIVASNQHIYDWLPLNCCLDAFQGRLVDAVELKTLAFGAAHCANGSRKAEPTD